MTDEDLHDALMSLAKISPPGYTKIVIRASGQRTYHRIPETLRPAFLAFVQALIQERSR